MRKKRAMMGTEMEKQFEKEFGRLTDEAKRLLKMADERERLDKEFQTFLQTLADKMIEIGRRCALNAGYDLKVKEVFILAIEELKIGQRL